LTNPDVKGFFDKATNTVSYVVADPATKKCAIIDSVLDYDPAAGRTSHASADVILAYVAEKGFTVEWILETHVHADHLTAAPYLFQKTHAAIGIGANITIVQSVFAKIFNAEADFKKDGSQFDRLLADGDSFKIGNLTATAMNTPGHTPACMVYVIGDAAFVGDTIFMPDFGTARCDFPGGDARVLYRSIKRIFALPPQTRLFMCHDYKAPGRDEFAWECTVAEQRAGNVHVRDGISEDEFVTMRTARDKQLGMPTLILPAVQLNMRAGAFPPPEDNGTSYIKIPLNAL
jgi:glyoxylase-like metal-dependent hydrolase (beta-lactamase superfamily II)